MKKLLFILLGFLPVLGHSIPLENQELPGFWTMLFRNIEGYMSYIWAEITFQTEPFYVNYFWWLVVLSLAVWGLEIAFPWRKNQGIIRKDFWLDAFYMFFNFFAFAMVINSLYAVIDTYYLRTGLTAKSLAIVDLSEWPMWLQLLVFFILTDFVQWITHVVLHRVPILWRFHKVHHSVQEMGFAAHLRYHWMENILYKPLKVLAIMLLGGFEPEMAFLVHFIAIGIGHLNHANLGWDYGPLKYVFNNPKMHIWHHAKEMPENHKFGMNFGISLSIWDYIFRTAHVPSSGRDIELGFEGIEKYPKTFLKQIISGFSKDK